MGARDALMGTNRAEDGVPWSRRGRRSYGYPNASQSISPAREGCAVEYG